MKIQHSKESRLTNGCRYGGGGGNAAERRLYFVYEQGHALRYPVGVGRPGKAWVGTTTIAGKHVQPAWSPPAEIKRDKPNLPDVIPGGTRRIRWARRR